MKSVSSFKKKIDTSAPLRLQVRIWLCIWVWSQLSSVVKHFPTTDGFAISFLYFLNYKKFGMGFLNFKNVRIKICGKYLQKNIYKILGKIRIPKITILHSKIVVWHYCASLCYFEKEARMRAGMLKRGLLINRVWNDDIYGYNDCYEVEVWKFVLRNRV